MTESHFPTQKEFVANRLYIGERRSRFNREVYLGPLGDCWEVPTRWSRFEVVARHRIGSFLHGMGITNRIPLGGPSPAPALMTYDGERGNFDWGNEGPGSLRLARCILALHLMDFAGMVHNSTGAAERLHVKFMQEVISKLPHDRFEMLGSDVTAWCEANEAECPTSATVVS